MKALLSLRRLYPIPFALFALGAYAQTPPSLAIRENGAQVDLTFSDTHTLEATDSLGGQWTTLGSQTSPFTDPDSAALPRRFYRINDAGVFSANAVGYYRLDLCEGFSLIANQLDTFDNTVTNLFKSPPDLTEVYKYNPGTGTYRYMLFGGGEWFSSHLETTLNPGEGMWLRTPVAFTHRFLGNVPLNRCVPITVGWNLVSCPLPRAGRPEGEAPGGLGFPIGDADYIFRWNCSRDRFAYRVYAGGDWFGGTPEVPILNIGEAFWIYKEPENGAAQWCGIFSVGP